MCIICGRTYAGRAAQPRWAFDHTGHLVGSVHKMHAEKLGKRYPYWDAPGDIPPDAARFIMWCRRIYAVPLDHTSDEYLAWLLANEQEDSHDDGQLSAKQLVRLEWWLHHESDFSIAPHRREGIVAAYSRLVASYTAWLAQVETERALSPGARSVY